MSNPNSSSRTGYVSDVILDARPAPKNTVGMMAWLRENLFDGVFNTLLTLLAILIIYLIVPPTIDWAITSAVWSGGSEACRANPDVACWPFIGIRWEQFLYGFYEKSERWRVDIVLWILFIGIALLIYGKTPKRNMIGIFMIVIYPIVTFFLLYGSETLGLEIVPTDQWGGFTLTLVIALTGIVASLPLGVVLALGRRSTMPVIKNILHHLH